MEVMWKWRPNDSEASPEIAHHVCENLFSFREREMAMFSLGTLANYLGLRWPGRGHR